MKIGEEIVVENLTLVYVDDFYEIKQYPGWTLSPTGGKHAWVLVCPNAIYRFWRDSMAECIKVFRTWMRWHVEKIETEWKEKTI